MMSLSAAILVATWTATFGLHSSSSTAISYSYFAFGSALRSRTARSAELRPPRPLTETPPVSGPMNPTLTLSLASAVAANDPANRAVARAAVVMPLMTISSFCCFHDGGIEVVDTGDATLRRGWAEDTALGSTRSKGGQ